MQDFFSSFGQFQLDSFEAEGSGSGFSLDEVTGVGSDANPDEYEVTVDDVKDNAFNDDGTPDEETIDEQAVTDPTTGEQIPQTYWEDNTAAVTTPSTVSGVTIDVQNAEERTTASGTKYFVININNIFGASFNNATVSKDNPIVFTKSNGNELTLAGLAGLAVSMLNGVLTGGSFAAGRKGRAIIGQRTPNGEIIYESDEVTLDVEGFTEEVTFVAEDSNLKSVTTDQSEGGVVTVEGDYKFTLDGNNFKLASTADDTLPTGAVVFTYGENGALALDISDIAVADGIINVSAVAGATTLIPPQATEATIRISGANYTYAAGDEAYFTLNSAGNPIGFVFGDDNDAIVLTKDTTITTLYNEDTDTTVSLGFVGTIEHTVTRTDEGFTVAVDFQDAGDAFFIDGENTAYTLAGITYNGAEVDVPTITGDIQFSMEMTAAGVFEITGIDAGTVVEGDNMTVTVEEDGGAVYFNTAGDIVGLGNYDGTIDLAAGQASDGFTVNGATITTDEAVTITAVDSTVTLITAPEGAGLATGTTIVVENADDAEIKFATNDDGNGVFTVNGKVFTVANDSNKVIYVNGAADEVDDLDSGASLAIDKGFGDITVNGQDYTADAIEAAAQDDGTSVIKGYTKNNSLEPGAYLEDPNYPLIDGTEANYTELAAKIGITTGEYTDPVYESVEQDDMKFSATDGKQLVYLDDEGDRKVTFADVSKNVAIVTDDAEGKKTITLGNKGDAVIMDGEDAYGSVNIIGGAGADSVVVTNTEATTFDMSKGGADKVITYAAANANVTLTGYDATSKAGIVVHDPALGDVKDINEAIADDLLVFEDGKVIAIDRTEAADGTERKSSITVNNKDGKHQTMVRVYGYKDTGDRTTDDNGQLVGFTGTDGGVLDASDISEDVILIGNRDGSHTVGSALKTGAGDDVIYAGAGDIIDAGKGINAVVLTEDTERDAATVVAGTGTTVIDNLNRDDVIDVSNLSSLTSIDFDGTILSVTDKSTKSTVTATVEATEADFVRQLFVNDGDELKAAIAVEGGTITVDSSDVPNYLKATDGAVDFSAYDGEVVVDMAEDWVQSEVGGTRATFVSGIASLIGGSGNTLFKGGAGSETLVAGIGESSLYGAGGKNSLVGSDSEDKFGSTEFFVQGINNGAQNTISNFEFIADGGSNTATFDALNLGMADGNEVTDLKANSDGTVSIAVKGGESGATEKVTIEGAAGQEFLVDRGTQTETVAQIAASEVTINHDYVDFYAATEKNATVTIGDVTSAKVWLEAPDFSDGVEYVGDFTVIDARGSNAAVEMAGNNVANTIYGGLGNASMWGGAGNANDVMYGGTAHNEFYYEVGNGNDTIMSANNGDIIHLGATLADIDFDKTTMSATGIDVAFNDGGTLKINSGSEVTFSFDDGTNVKANRAENRFE